MGAVSRDSDADSELAARLASSSESNALAPAGRPARGFPPWIGQPMNSCRRSTVSCRVTATMALLRAVALRLASERTRAQFFSGVVVHQHGTAPRSLGPIANSPGTKGKATVDLSKGQALDQFATSHCLLDHPNFAGGCRIRAFLNDGSTSDMSLGPGSDRAYRCLHNVPKEDGARLQLRYFPNHYQLVFRIDQLPWMPPDSRDVTNFFETRIPHVEVKRSSNLFMPIEMATQCSFTDYYTSTARTTLSARLFPESLRGRHGPAAAGRIRPLRHWPAAG